MRGLVYVVSLNYEEEIEKMLSLLDIESVKRILDSKQGKNKKQFLFLVIFQLAPRVLVEITVYKFILQIVKETLHYFEQYDTILFKHKTY